MVELLSFFVILTAGLLFSEMFRRLHLPYVTTLILAGVLIGPHALDLIALDETALFFASIGVIFLMFIAGSEIKIGFFQKMKKEIFVISILNSTIPFITGFSIAWYFGYSLFISLILGVIFISSSIAVIIPSLESCGLMKERVGKTIISATVFEDIASLVLLGILLQSITQKTPLPLPIYVLMIIPLLFVLKATIPKIEGMYHRGKIGRSRFESELRFVFVVLLGTVILFELLGMHAIIAGFIIGLILSDSIRGKIEEKIRTVSYGIFIPVFFLVIGMQADFSVYSSGEFLVFALVVVVGLVLSKIVSGFIAGALIKFSARESLLIGVSTIPQLSTTLAAAFAAMEFGLLSREIISSLIVLSIVTTFAAPILIKMISPVKN